MKKYKIVEGPNKGKILPLKTNKRLTTGIFILAGHYHESAKEGYIYGQDADFGLIAKIGGRPTVVQPLEI